jgi:hypothetical protein
MIREISLITFNDGVSDELQYEALERLQRLGDICPTIGSWSVGVNYADTPDPCDLIQTGDFRNKADFDAYKTHPERIAYEEFIGPLARLAIGEYDPDEVRDEDLLMKARSTPELELSLEGVIHDYTMRGNAAYNRLREKLVEVTNGRLSTIDVGKFLTQFVKGHVPKAYFKHVPNSRLRYLGTIREPADIDAMKKHFGSIRAGHVILVLQKLAEQQAMERAGNVADGHQFDLFAGEVLVADADAEG